VGSILVAMNPYKDIPGLYSETARSKYTCAPSGAELAPHIWGMSREAYARMARDGENQVRRGALRFGACVQGMTF
jgi:myosin X